MVEAPDNSEAVAALNRARDLAAQQDQGHTRLVHSLDGYVYECMSGLPDATMDLEPRPQREHPNSRIGFAVRDAEGQRGAVLRRLDLTGTFNPPQVVFHKITDDEMAVTRMPGLLAGIAPQHPWQVVHAGDNRWVVGAGTVTNRGEATSAKVLQLGQTEVNAADAWICLRVDWDITSQDVFHMRAARVRVSDDLEGTLRFRYEDEVPVWQPGTCLYPIARVRAGGERPLVAQTRFGHFFFGGPGFRAGAFGPAALLF